MRCQRDLRELKKADALTLISQMETRPQHRRLVAGTRPATTLSPVAYISTDFIGDLMQFLGIYGLSDKMNSMISAVADNIFGIVWNSGIQIIIFLAALQNIHPSVREAAEVEGATAWEFFWKITFPYVSPFILANFIYTVIDSFTSPMNTVMARILDMKSQWSFGYASAMAWIYFAIVLGVIGLVSIVISRVVYYEVD